MGAGSGGQAVLVLWGSEQAELVARGCRERTVCPACLLPANGSQGHLWPWKWSQCHCEMTAKRKLDDFLTPTFQM